MKYKRFGEDIVARLEVGEEVIASLSDIAEREGVTFAEVSGIGAADEFDVSVYDVKAKVYFDNTFREPLELTSLSGTVTEMNGEPYIHIHATAGRAADISNAPSSARRANWSCTPFTAVCRGSTTSARDLILWNYEARPSAGHRNRRLQ